MTPKWPSPKVPHIYVKVLSTGPKISLRFALLSLVFQIIEVFNFSMGYKVEFAIFGKTRVKNWKLKISKNPQRSFVRTIRRKIQDKFQKIWLQLILQEE